MAGGLDASVADGVHLVFGVGFQEIESGGGLFGYDFAYLHGGVLKAFLGVLAGEFLVPAAEVAGADDFYIVHI